MNNQTTKYQKNNLSVRIMRRVYLIAVIRIALHPILLKTLIAGVFFWQSTRYVSYQHVLANAPNLLDLESNVRFFSGAIAHTTTTTLYLYFGIVSMILWMIVDMARHKTHAWV